MIEENYLSLDDSWSLGNGAGRHQLFSPHWPQECDYKVILVRACCTP